MITKENICYRSTQEEMVIQLSPRSGVIFTEVLRDGLSQKKISGKRLPSLKQSAHSNCVAATEWLETLQASAAILIKHYSLVDYMDLTVRSSSTRQVMKI